VVVELTSLGGDLAGALESITVPSYVIAPNGLILWLNDAARQIVGDVQGREYTSVVAPEDVRRARERFARNVIGAERVPDQELTLIAKDGRRIRVEISSVPLIQGHHLIGIFGQAADIQNADEQAPHPALTPRQTEVLRLLEQGRSTQQIADELHLSVETVRNHVRRLLRALGVHTRLEAVALSRQGWRPEQEK
jgi:PAS domain S-box-containing protein